jgi:hypothetical protein
MIWHEGIRASSAVCGGGRRAGESRSPERNAGTTGPKAEALGPNDKIKRLLPYLKPGASSLSALTRPTERVNRGAGEKGRSGRIPSGVLPHPEPLPGGEGMQRRHASGLSVPTTCR